MRLFCQEVCNLSVQAENVTTVTAQHQHVSAYPWHPVASTTQLMTLVRLSS
jgi:hypothetical protein